jgi:hypothetical protein
VIIAGLQPAYGWGLITWGVAPSFGITGFQPVQAAHPELASASLRATPTLLPDYWVKVNKLEILNRLVT